MEEKKLDVHNNNPLISVVVPVYNVEKYLAECLNSIVGQTYQNIEIIVIDDGSTDSSSSICDKYAAKDKRLHLIHQCFFAIVFPKNLHQNSNKFADGIPGNLQLQIC